MNNDLTNNNFTIITSTRSYVMSIFGDVIKLKCLNSELPSSSFQLRIVRIPDQIPQQWHPLAAPRSLKFCSPTQPSTQTYLPTHQNLPTFLPTHPLKPTYQPTYPPTQTYLPTPHKNLPTYTPTHQTYLPSHPPKPTYLPIHPNLPSYLPTHPPKPTYPPNQTYLPRYLPRYLPTYLAS